MVRNKPQGVWGKLGFEGHVDGKFGLGAICLFIRIWRWDFQWKTIDSFFKRIEQLRIISGSDQQGYSYEKSCIGEQKGYVKTYIYLFNKNV